MLIDTAINAIQSLINSGADDELIKRLTILRSKFACWFLFDNQEMMFFRADRSNNKRNQSIDITVYDFQKSKKKKLSLLPKCRSSFPCAGTRKL